MEYLFIPSNDFYKKIIKRGNWYINNISVHQPFSEYNGWINSYTAGFQFHAVIIGKNLNWIVNRPAIVWKSTIREYYEILFSRAHPYVVVLHEVTPSVFTYRMTDENNVLPRHFWTREYRDAPFDLVYFKKALYDALILGCTIGKEEIADELDVIAREVAMYMGFSSEDKYLFYGEYIVPITIFTRRLKSA